MVRLRRFAARVHVVSLRGAIALLLPAAVLLAFGAEGAGAATPGHPFLPAISQEEAFNRPCGAATDSAGDVYVQALNGFNSTNSVSVFGPTGALITRFSTSANSVVPCDLAVDALGRVYAAGQLDVVRYKPSSYPPNAGTTYEADTSLNGTGKLAVARPVSVAVDPSNQNVYVTEAGRNEEQAFNRPTEAECATATKFTITYAPTGQTSGELECTAEFLKPSRAELTAALEAILGAGNVSVRGNNALKTVSFTGALGGSDIPDEALEVKKGTSSEAGGLISKSTTAANGEASHVSSFDSSGTLLSSSIGAELVPAAQYYGVDVYGDTGDVYVTDPPHDSAYVLNPAGTAILATITGADSPHGSFTAMGKAQLAVDQANGNVFISDIPGHGVVDEFDSAGAFVSQIGPTFGTRSRSFAEAEPSAIAVDGSAGPTAGNVYVSSGNGPGGSLWAFGPLVAGLPPEVEAGVADAITQNSAQLHANVNPNGEATISCELTWHLEGGGGAGSAPCSPSPGSSSGSVAVGAEATGLVAHGAYAWSVVIETAAGLAEDDGPSFVASSPPSATTEPATAIGEAGATLNGSVNPAGGAGGSCRFEYDTVPYDSPAEAPHGASAACVPDPGAAQAAVAVSASPTNLSSRTTYYFRIVEATDGGTARGQGASFTTVAQPEVLDESARLAQTSATLEAEIRPSGLPTSFHFQYVEQSTCDRDVAEAGLAHCFDHANSTAGVPIGDDFSLHRVSAAIAGLQTDTAYRYRAVATNSSAAVSGATASLRTLNDRNLPDGRGAEMVSPADLGPTGTTIPSLGGGVAWQAAQDGNRMVFPIHGGLPDSTAGDAARYLATRTSGGWYSAQLSPPSLAPSSGNMGAYNIPGSIRALSPDLDCDAYETFSPVSSVPPVPAGDEGVSNLFLHREDGENLLLTPSKPTNPTVDLSSTAPFTVNGLSADCSTALFESPYVYPGVAASGLYEWSAGALRNVGVLPGGSLAADARAGGGSAGGESFANALSSDGGTAFFSASTSEPGHAPSSLGIFARIDGSSTLDLSRSTTAVPDRGAVYQAAAVDGSRVFFLANYGLTPSASNGATTSNCASGSPSEDGCDLYEYNLERRELVDLTATSAVANPQGAAAGGVLGLSDDGRRVYLATRAQLVPGKGNTYAQNTSGAGAYNVYLSQEGPDQERSLSFVGLVASPLAQAEVGAPFITKPNNWSSRVNPDGSALLFVSILNTTGYDSEGAAEAYLYSTETGRTRCVSCRPDGQPPLPNPTRVRLIAMPLKAQWPNQVHNPRTLSAGGDLVFFASVDVLAPGGVAGNKNLYEWNRGAVSLLFTEPAGGEVQNPFLDASANGDNVFIVTSAHLLPWAQGERLRVYDLRTGGGFPEPPGPPQRCDALVEGACQRALNPAAAVSNLATPIYSGPGNPATPRPRCAPGKVRKKGKAGKAGHRCVPRHRAAKQRHAHRHHRRAKGSKTLKHADQREHTKRRTKSK